MTRAIIWAAVSTLAQTHEDKYSLPAQEADGLAFCEREGFEVVEVLRVPGHSRNYKSLEKLATDARAKGINAFDRLIHHLETCDFDVLVCRDANRFARKASLLHFIVESVIEDCGARIYSFNDGWVDETNADIFAMVKGYTTARERKWLIEAGKNGKAKLLENGLPTGNQVAMSHKRVRDPETGKDIAIVLNEQLTRLWQDLAEVILSGMTWQFMGSTLYERYGHVDHTGRPYSSRTLYSLVLNPLFWGHTSSGYHTASKGRWVFDPDYPAPEGVIIHHNTVPPVYQGEVAEAVKAELIRRMSIRGHASPLNTYRFSGLFVCGTCGYTMTSYVRAGERAGLCCATQYREIRSGVTCKQWRFKDEAIRPYMDTLLRQLLDGMPLPFESDQADDSRLELLTADQARLEGQVDLLIHEQSLAPVAVQERYRSKVMTLSRQLEQLEAEIARTKEAARDRSRVQTQRTQVIEDIRETTLEGFWQLPQRQVNQLLRRLLGDYQLVALNKKIIGMQKRKSRN